MANQVLEALLRHLHDLADNPAVSDERLLTLFREQRDASAFSRLMRRHGPMVFNVCRRIVRDSHLAEDVFQATFLVLAGGSKAIRQQGSLPAWLHGIAHRLALKAAQRAQLPVRPPAPVAADPADALDWRDMLAALDEELQGLPDRYRLPLILCYLEGRTRDEAAKQLGWSVGTLRRRLEGGRKLLHARLTRRGFTLPAALGGLLVAEAARVPAALHAAALTAAVRWAACPGASGLVAASVAALAKEGVPVMIGSMSKMLGVGVLLAALGAGAVGYQVANGPPTTPAPKAPLPDAAPAKRLPDRADALVREAAEAVQAAGNENYYRLLSMAALEARRGNVTAAKQWFDQSARAMARIPGDRRAYVLAYLGSHQADAGDRTTARENLVEARRLGTAVTAYNVRNDILQLVATVVAEKLDPAEAIEYANAISTEKARREYIQFYAANTGISVSSDPPEIVEAVLAEGMRLSVLTRIARQQARTGDVAAARRTMALLAHIVPHRSKIDMLQQLAAAQLKDGDSTGARNSLQQMEEAVAYDRKHGFNEWPLIRTNLLANFALAQSKAGDRDGARASWAQAQRTAEETRGSQQIGCLAVLAEAQAKAGERTAALDTLRRALKIAEGYADDHFPLTSVVSVKVAVGDWSGAAQAIAKLPEGQRTEWFGAMSRAGQMERALDGVRELKPAGAKAAALITVARVVLDKLPAAPPVKAGTFRVQIPAPVPGTELKPKAPAPTPLEEFYTLVQVDEDAWGKYNKALASAKDNEERARLQRDGRPKEEDFAGRMLELAKRNPREEASLEALLWIVEYARNTSAARTALVLLTQDHVAAKKVGLACRLAIFSRHRSDVEPLLRTVLDKSPHSSVRGETCLALARYLKEEADWIRRAKRPMPASEARRVESDFGANWWKRLQASDPEKLRGEAETLYEKVLAEWPDFVPYRSTESLGESARSALNELRLLGIGKLAPEIVGEDLEGRPLKLSEHRGKVVVIVFWATWCGPCRAMIPYERALVKRLEGKPFVLLGVNGDDDREKLKSFLAKEPLPYRSWWDGKPGDGDGGHGPIVKFWNVSSWPTVYVLDRKGVIRFRDVHDKELDAAVYTLLQE